MPHAEALVDAEAIRDEWVGRLGRLVDDIETWAGSLGWAARRIDKAMRDATIGPYQAPGLLLQKEFTRILVDPIGRITPGSEGLVDVYVMPALDDIASLYYYENRWNVHDHPPDDAAATARDAEARPLTGETLAEVLDVMACRAS